MNHRILAVAALIAAALPAPGASAAKAKPLCRLVSDPAGDVDLAGIPYADDAIDMVSADLAADTHQLTVALRPKRLALPKSPFTTARYEAYVRVRETGFAFSARRDAAGADFDVSTYAASGHTATGEKIGPIKGVLDTARNEIRMTAPAALLAPYVTWRNKDRMVFFAIRAALSISPDRNAVSTLGPGDAEDDDYTYQVGTPTCVTPVR